MVANLDNQMGFVAKTCFEVHRIGFLHLTGEMGTCYSACYSAQDLHLFITQQFQFTAAADPAFCLMQDKISFSVVNTHIHVK